MGDSPKQGLQPGLPQMSAGSQIPGQVPLHPPSYEQALQHQVLHSSPHLNSQMLWQMQAAAAAQRGVPMYAAQQPVAPAAYQVPPGYVMAPQQVAPAGYGYASKPHPAAPQAAVQLPYGYPQPAAPPGSTVVIKDAFDSGARFDGISQPTIPPVPPGMAPNAAQMAMYSQQNVVTNKKKESFLTGGKGGGYTFW